MLLSPMSLLQWAFCMTHLYALASHSGTDILVRMLKGSPKLLCLHCVTDTIIFVSTALRQEPMYNNDDTACIILVLYHVNQNQECLKQYLS